MLVHLWVVVDYAMEHLLDYYLLDGVTSSNYPSLRSISFVGPVSVVLVVQLALVCFENGCSGPCSWSLFGGVGEWSSRV